MPKFDVERIYEIDGKLKFYKLVKDGNCALDEFEELCSTNLLYESEFVKLQTIMQEISELRFNRISPKKYKELHGRKKSDLIKDYEVKTKNLRLYFFKDEIGRIIVLGGKKGTQIKDIKRMRSIKNQYQEDK